MEDEEEKKKARKKIRGHTDSVICLSSNPNDRSELASGSADKSVLFWDLNEMKRKSSLKSLHKDRVQSIRFHPTEQFTLLSGSADCTVRVNDSREDKSSSSSWRFKNEIEKVLWVYNEDNYFLCTDDNGYIHLNDRRVEDKSLASVQVGDESSPALMGMSSLVPGLLVTVAEENDIVKVWDLDVNKATLDMLAYKKVKLGSINCIESSPDSGFVFTFGGTKSTSPLVWDLRELDEVRERFYLRLGIKEQEEEKEAARAKEERISKRQARAQKFKEIKANRFNPENGNNHFSNKPNFTRPNKSQHFNNNNKNKQTFTNNKTNNSNKKPNKN